MIIAIGEQIRQPSCLDAQSFQAVSISVEDGLYTLLWPAYRHQSPHVQVLIPSNFSWSFSCHYPAAFPSHTQEHKLEVILQKGTLVSDLGPGRKQLATFTSSECRLQLLLHKIKSSSVCHFPMLLTDKRFRINWKTISQFF